MESVLRRLQGHTILVTGASGFLGSAVVRQLARVPCTIRRLDREFRPDPPTEAGQPAQIEDVVGDVREIGSWMTAAADADVILHLAGQTSVYVANDDPEADLVANVQPVLHLLQAARVSRKRPAVVYAGTATVVGLTTDSKPVDESHPDCPITFYDVHKWVAERYLEAYTTEGTISATTLRLANVYGPGPRGTSKERGFLNAMIRRAIGGEPLTLYGDGIEVRDYVYVEDVAHAFLTAAAFTDAVSGRHFLIGSGRGTTIAGALDCVAGRVALRTGNRVPVVSVTPPAGLSLIEERSFVADTKQFQAATGWTAPVSLEEGIDRTIAAMCSGPGA